MGQCYPSKTCQKSSFSDLPPHNRSVIVTRPKSRKSSTRRPHHSYPPQNFQTMYKRSQIVSKQLFLNSGFMEDDYIYSPYLPEHHDISEEQTTHQTEITQSPDKHVISATFAYSASNFSSRTYRLNTDTSLALPKLVFDITDRSYSSPNCTTFITVTSGDNFVNLPPSLVTKVSLDSLVSDDSNTTPTGEMGRVENYGMETVAYF
ncbi:hypothetical protein ACHWQZ_G017562 [Mnemiopsis leidyi]